MNKFRIIHLIESDVQLTMRIAVRIRNEVNIELDDRVTKSNHDPRPGHSTENEFFENRLVLDYILVTGKHTTRAMTDLQDFYDMQLAKIGSIVQDLVGVETKLTQLAAKILPKMDHYMSAAFGISKECHGGRGKALTGTRQVNVCLCIFRWLMSYSLYIDI